MTKGRGNWFESLAKEKTEFFPGEAKIRVCRPLKEFLPKEIYYYMHSNQLTDYVITRTNLTTQVSNKLESVPGKGNFTKVLDDFLNKLQDEFPSTIFTVLNTSEKIKMDMNLLYQRTHPEEPTDQAHPSKPKVADMEDDKPKAAIQANVPTKNQAPIGRCHMCRGILDSSNLLESGYDKELIGLKKMDHPLSVLQKSYESGLTPFEVGLCHACKRIMQHASNKQIISNFFTNPI